MNRQEILLKLKPILSTYAQKKDHLEQISEDTDFIKDLEINSASLVDVVLDVEQEFGIEIDNQSMEKMLTVRAAVDVISNELQHADGE